MPEATEDTTPTLAQELELRLAESRGVLSGNDELIATFLRDHLHELAFHTAESLAQGAGVSGAAVVRFARRLEFASFRELRDRARSELRPAPNAEPVADPAADAEPGTSTLTRKTQGDIASLELLPRLLGDAIETAAQVVAQARTAWFLANRETHGLAVYAHRLLFQARGRVALINPAFPDPIRDLGPDDALIACTFRPYARNTIELLSLTRETGARIVLITDGLAHDFIGPEDVVLAVPVDSPTLFLSFTPALCVLETLCALVAAQDPDRTYASLEATARFLEDHRVTLERPVVAPAPRVTGPTPR
jgi:DNA-binding MurR/RpiR family transcriptional regulator